MTSKNAAGERGPERQIVLFKVVSALAEQLRGVFVPYYKHLLDLSVAHLGGALEKGTPGKKKKQKLATGSEYGGPDAGLLRLQVISFIYYLLINIINNNNIIIILLLMNLFIYFIYFILSQGKVVSKALSVSRNAALLILLTLKGCMCVAGKDDEPK